MWSFLHADYIRKLFFRGVVDAGEVVVTDANPVPMFRAENRVNFDWGACRSWIDFMEKRQTEVIETGCSAEA